MTHGPLTSAALLSTKNVRGSSLNPTALSKSPQGTPVPSKWHCRHLKVFLIHSLMRGPQHTSLGRFGGGGDGYSPILQEKGLRPREQT